MVWQVQGAIRNHNSVLRCTLPEGGGDGASVTVRVFTNNVVSNSGAIVYVPCQPGTHWDAQSSTCIPCAPGTYALLSGQPICTDCARGFASSESGKSGCDPCTQVGREHLLRASDGRALMILGHGHMCYVQ